MRYEPKPNLNRAYALGVCANGVCVVYGPGENRKESLPVHTCDSRDMAETVKIMLCSLTYDGKDYMLSVSLFDPMAREKERLESLQRVGEAMARAEMICLAKKGETK